MSFLDRVLPTLASKSTTSNMSVNDPINNTTDDGTSSVDKNFSIALSKSDLFGSTANSIPGNLHYCSDKQISKLINKHGAVNLVKQLSNDLSIREAELILLRKEKTLREMELIKLLNEYGNLSTIEIEKKLSSLKVEKNVNNVLKELISNAMDEQIDESSIKKLEPKPLENPENFNSSMSIRLDNSKSTVSSGSSNVNTFFKEGAERLGKHIEYETRLKEGRNQAKSRQSWLVNWFSSTDDLISYNSLAHLTSSSSNSKNRVGSDTPNEGVISPSRPHSLSMPALHGTSPYNKVPVELDSIVPQRFQPPIFTIKSSNKIDKYGFFVDGDLVKKNCDSSSMEKLKPSNENTNIENRLVSQLPSNHHIIQSSNILDNDRLKLKLKSIGDLDDIRNKQIETKWDEFFKNLNNDYYNDSNSNSPTIPDEDMIGLRGLNLQKVKHNNQAKSHYLTFTKLINYGIPMKYRSKLWLECSGAKNKKVPGEFTNILQNHVISETDLAQIDLDLNRTMPYNIFFNNLIDNAPGPGLAKLENILIAFCKKNPDIGYCQGMNKIIAIFLLIYSNEEDVFWLFQSLCDNILTKNFFKNPLIDVRIDQKVLKLLFQKLMPELNLHFTKLGIELEIITFSWFLSIFAENCLPIEILFKIYDNLIVFGEIKLFSISLSIFKIFEKNLLLIEDVNSVYLIMKNLINNGNLNIKFDSLIQTSIDFEKFFDMNFVIEQRSIEWKFYQRNGYI